MSVTESKPERIVVKKAETPDERAQEHLAAEVRRYRAEAAKYAHKAETARVRGQADVAVEMKAQGAYFEAVADRIEVGRTYKRAPSAQSVPVTAPTQGQPAKPGR